MQTKFYLSTVLGLLALIFLAEPVAHGQRFNPSIVPDVSVTDQDGRSHLFYTDLIKGRIVAINFAYTSCVAVCPRQGERFGSLQSLLGAHLNADTFLLTVTTDPVNDTSAKLKTWGSQFGAKPGWSLLTGSPINIQKILERVYYDKTAKGRQALASRRTDQRSA